MKFNDLFNNRKNIYFASMLIIVLVLAGGIWQYNNYISNRMSEFDFEDQLSEYTDNIEDQVGGDLGAQIIESKPAEGNTDSEPIKEVLKTDEPKKPKMPMATQETKNNPEKTVATTKTPAVNMDTMVLPVFGSVSTEFSDTALIYSKTLDQWTTHSGLDIKAEEGSPVRAALDGTVVEVVNDAEWGMTIVLDHGNDIFTRYSNLSTLDLVNMGQQIKKGDVISGVGKSALCEIAEEPHLHFEVISSKQHIDPKNYLPKQSLKK